MTDPTIDPIQDKGHQTQQHYSLVRQLLFPFSAEEPLSFAQGMRVIVGWIALFTPGIVVIILIATWLTGASLQKTLLLLLLGILIGVFIFGLTGWFTVSINNRAARMLQARRAMKATTARGGRYGS